VANPIAHAPACVDYRQACLDAREWAQRDGRPYAVVSYGSGYLIVAAAYVAGEHAPRCTVPGCGGLRDGNGACVQHALEMSLEAAE
jgi:hypothetical protein